MNILTWLDGNIPLNKLCINKLLSLIMTNWYNMTNFYRMDVISYLRKFMNIRANIDR